MILFVDFNDGGHHPRHIEHVLRLGSGALLTSVRALRQVDEKILASSTIEVISSEVNPLFFREHVKLIYETLESRPEISRCIHLAIDDVFKWILGYSVSLGFRVPIEGVWMSCNTFYNRRIGFKNKFTFSLLAITWQLYAWVWSVGNFPRIYFLNEELAKWALQHLAYGKRWVRWVIDPPDALNTLIWMSRVPIQNRIAFVGVHTERKGTLWALQALEAWDGGNLEIIVAGIWPNASGLVDAIAKLPRSICLRLEASVISNDALMDIYKTAEIVVVPYRQFGNSSGVVVNALCAGCKVLVTDYGILGVRLRKYNSAFVFEQNSQVDFVKKLKKLISAPPDFALYDGIRRYSSASKYVKALESP